MSVATTAKFNALRDRIVKLARTENWTPAKFLERTGRRPEDDDLDRVNCDKALTPGHRYCGVCEHDLPRFFCETCQSIEQQSVHL